MLFIVIFGKPQSHMLKKQTYVEENRIAGYFNYKYSIEVRAYAYDKNLTKSDAIVLMAREFLDNIPEADRKRMVDNYLKDLKLGEVK
jgi:hypothetical protein